MRVTHVDTFSLPQGSLLALASPQSTGAAGASASSSSLSFAHNAAADVKITAECSDPNAGLSLNVNIEGGVGTRTLYAGSSSMGAQDVLTRLPAGVFSGKAVVYTAHAKPLATPTAKPAASPEFTVTYTSLEQ